MVDILLEDKKSSYGCCLVGKFKNSDIVVVLLAYLTIQIWFMSWWYVKNPDMVIDFLASSK